MKHKQANDMRLPNMYSEQKLVIRNELDMSTTYHIRTTNYYSTMTDTLLTYKRQYLLNNVTTH